MPTIRTLTNRHITMILFPPCESHSPKKKKSKNLNECMVHIHFRPHLFIDENTSSQVLLSWQWHMLSFLSLALAVSNAVASAVLMQVSTACFSTFPYTPHNLFGRIYSRTQRLSSHCAGYSTPLSEHKVTLSLPGLRFFFLTSITNCTFTVALRRCKPTVSRSLMI